MSAKTLIKLVILLITIMIGEGMKKSIHEKPANSDGSWEISCVRGEIISIKLRGNKTTGFSWYLQNKETLSKNIIRPLNLDENNSTNHYEMDENPQHLMGVGGYFYFDFKIPVKAENQIVELVFNHKRPWEDHSSLLHVKVNIGEKNEL